MNYQQKNYLIEHLRYVLASVFQSLLLLFLLALLIKEFNPSFINQNINLNWFMVVVIFFGILSVLIPVKEERVRKKSDWKDYLFILVLSIISAFILFFKLNYLGWIGYVLSLLGALIIFFLSWLLINEEEDQSESAYTLG